MSNPAGIQSPATRQQAPSVWDLTLDASKNEKDLVVAVRDYLATWQPSELSQFPEACRPGKITSGEDIADMAFRMTKFRMNFGTVLDELSPEDHASLDRLTNFFQHASERFAEIAAAPRPLPT